MDVCCEANQNNNILNLSIILRHLKQKEQTLKELNSHTQLVHEKGLHFEIRNYLSVNKTCEENAFLSNLYFWEDIEFIVKQAALFKKDEKLDFVKSRLNTMNEKLPGTAYIPFKRSMFLFHFLLTCSIKFSMKLVQINTVKQF